MPSETIRPARRRQQRREELAKWAFLTPAIAFLLLFFGYPIIKNVTMSLQEYTTKTFYTGEAPFVGLDNYIAVIRSSVFTTALLNTVLFTVGSIIGQFTIGLALAVFFKKRFPLSGVMRSLLLLPWLLPMIVSSAIWKWMLDKDSGVINQVLGLLHLDAVPWLTSTSVALIAVIMVNIWLGIPFNMTILYSGLQDIPDELYEAAALDGAVGWKAFRNVTWPLLRPVVSVVLILGVVYTLKVLDIILGLTGGGPSTATETLATQSYKLSFANFEFGQGAALGNILVIIALVFALVYLRVTRSSNQD
ncbi:carbohydrate ABC transporter permease [Actinomyces urogenitalis]|uniref:carbohydrate ABC transporter permease n=1 Tax=Actinomyces urogenitalis TaxID=103621 RepID=UPI00050FBBD3|nr:sugar ABC transporter permease [Actinomyces urogenitalis]KGF04002.1 ABC transporter permease [Actinomyces urogenitalis S6-C4]MDK8237977.1 sugar ABC transporter permease [Actinomyces urogenitalis]MDU0865086.1 sugar ABC transporter permease [Actinomyces urogenitalis]MDU0875538.1 sugar ABC transporter permease [Actinomyces urogenitalis]MDU1564093.1 sugar ABC transporter permease [Actinomyces urogenitalis]